MSPLYYVGTALLLLAAVPANLICFLYFNVPWKKTRLGRVMAAKALALALILDLSIIASLVLIAGWERPLWFEIVRLIVLGLVGVSLWFQYHEYRALLRDRKPHEDVSGHSFS